MVSSHNGNLLDLLVQLGPGTLMAGTMRPISRIFREISDDNFISLNLNQTLYLFQ